MWTLRTTAEQTNLDLRGMWEDRLMSYGPSNQWRPADPGTCAKLVCDIATGESPELYAPPDDYRRERELRAKQGGKARAEKLAPERHGTRVSRVTGAPDPKHINTSNIEHQNLEMRMGKHRYQQLSDAFSQKLKSHAHHVALHFAHYNFCRIHKTLRVTPAMAAGVTSEPRDVDWIAELVETRDPKPGPRGPYKKHLENR